MVVYLRLIKESFGFAMNALRNNKLRTLLSLLGVTIGIFSIIAVLTAVDSLDRKIKSELSVLDKNTIYLTKFSFGPSEIPRWKRDQFPDVSYEEYEYLKSSLPEAKELAFQLFVARENIKYNEKTVSSINVVPVSYEFIDIQGLEFSSGRFYNESEAYSGAAVVVIGDEIANNLFEGSDPIGKEVRLYGQRFHVIGVLNKQGEGMFGDSNDTSVFIPVNYMRKRFGDNNETMTPVIVIKPQKEIDMDAFQMDISQKLRGMRGMKTGEIDNFFINVFSGFTDLLDGIISSMNVGGWIIAGFSLLVGGFGVANIMFVTVRERTSQIGLKKAIGAKRSTILTEFLLESAFLCIIGGLVGLTLVWLLSLVLSSVLPFPIYIAPNIVILGLSICIVLGVLAGIIPASIAAKMDPVVAIRTK